MRNLRVSMKKQQPNICKLRKFLNEGLDEEEDRLFGECYGRYYSEIYTNNSRTKSLHLSYYYGCLETVYFNVNGKRTLIIMDESDFKFRQANALEEFYSGSCMELDDFISKDYLIVPNCTTLEDYLTDEMRAVMHECCCRRAAHHRKFKEFRKTFILSTIEECLD